MDLATIIGIIVGLGLCVFGIVTGEEGPAAIVSFLHLPSFIITVGGTFSSVLTSCTIQEYIAGLKGFLVSLKMPKVNEPQTINTIIELSNIARKEGLLSLEDAANNLEDQFMKKGVLLIVDGTDPELVRSILETELNCIEGRHKKVSSFWDKIAAMGPAWGMIGTLIGLILMLKNLQDADSIGPNMSIALITTFYGSLLANWIGIPIATKLRTYNEMEIVLKEVMIEGLLSIQAGENPRVIEEKLKSFLSPKQRESMSVDGGEEVA